MISVERRKRALRLIAACLLLVLSACVAEKEWDAFDPDSVGVVDVAVCPAYGDDLSPEYYVLAGGRRIQAAPEFDSGDSEIYYVGHDCFEAYIGHVDTLLPDKTRVLNRLVHMELHDENGGPVRINEEMEAIFHQVAGLEHEVFDVRIIVADGEYFVFHKLNVNWQLPCVLSYYNRDSDRLIELYRWQEREIVGLRIRSLARLQACR